MHFGEGFSDVGSELRRGEVCVRVIQERYGTWLCNEGQMGGLFGFAMLWNKNMKKCRQTVVFYIL